MAPGQSVSRALTINNTSGTFTYTISTSCTVPNPCNSPIWTDSVNGLQLKIQRGTTMIFTGPIQVTNQPIYDNSATNTAIVLNPAQTDTLTITVTLPTTAGNNFQGQSVTLNFTWTGSSTT